MAVCPVHVIHPPAHCHYPGPIGNHKHVTPPRMVLRNELLLVRKQLRRSSDFSQIMLAGSEGIQIQSPGSGGKAYNTLNEKQNQ
jgi:hypothetical protein